MNVKVRKTPVGAIVGRFQVPDLHPGHLELLDQVTAAHSKVIILVGSTPGVLVTRRNPLDFYTRKLMIQQKYPTAVILPIHDMPSDEDWSKSVDQKIAEVVGDHIDVTLYGSRDAFIPHYSGRYASVELEFSSYVSGTEVRDAASDAVRESSEFRRGVVYAAYNRHNHLYLTVDVIAVRDDKIALGRKKTDPVNKLRFPGGFVDPIKDLNLDMAAQREAKEEICCTLGNFRYLGSTMIDDWRYKKEVDKIMTTVFTADYMYGILEPSDDLDYVDWYSVNDETRSRILTQHQKIFDMFVSHLEKENGK